MRKEGRRGREGDTGGEGMEGGGVGRRRRVVRDRGVRREVGSAGWVEVEEGGGRKGGGRGMEG